MQYFIDIEIAKKTPEILFNKWIITSILEFFTIIVLLFIILKKKQKKTDDNLIDKHISEYKDADVNLQNVFNSMFNSKGLYDTLKKEIHEDRFPLDTEKRKIAGELAMSLNENKSNYYKLNEIKAIAMEKLGLTF